MARLVSGSATATNFQGWRWAPEGAVEAVLKTHPAAQVDLYLVTIYMMDPSTWRNLPVVMRKRLPASAAE